jgi:NAD(P)-dependent dehydrogenase (short-subunit alcohol dehydrogenase family)
MIENYSYTASKAAVHQLTRYLRREEGGKRRRRSG